MNRQPFTRWPPRLVEGIRRRTLDSGETVLEGEDGRYLASVPAHLAPLLDLLDGRHTVADLLGALARSSGRLSPPELLSFLSSLKGAGALVSAAQFPVGADQARGLVVSRLGARLSDLQWMFPLRSRAGAWPRGRGLLMGRQSLGFGLAAGALVALLASLALAGLPKLVVDSDSFVLMFTGMSLALSFRGCVRFLTATLLGRPPRSAGIRMRFGVPFIDVNAATPAGLAPRGQTLFALMGLGGLALFAGIAGLVAHPSLFWGGLAAFLLDACPFARSDGALLLERMLGIRWTRGRAAAYLASSLLHKLGTAQRPEGEESRLLLTLAIWSAYVCVLTPLVIVPGTAAMMESMVLALVAAGLTPLWLLNAWGALWLGGLAVAAVVHAGFLLAGLLRQLTARFFESQLLEQRSPDESWAIPLRDALTASAVDPPEELGTLLGAGHLVHMSAGQLYPETDRFLPAYALVIQGSALVTRTEVSGMTHISGRAEPGWIMGRGQNPRHGWRFRLKAEEPVVIWELEEPDDLGSAASRLLAMAQQVDNLEHNPAVWSLGPAGVRLLAALPGSPEPTALSREQLEAVCPPTWRDLP